MINNKKTVFVGVSGGVDSAVSVALLKDQGFDVVGVFIRTWNPDFTPCAWRDERRDAMRVCAHLSIPFLECDAEEVYKEKVAEYMIEEYRNGRTPNPDVMCNREVKFGVFWDFAKEKGADFIATGHYARVFRSQGFCQSSLSLSASRDYTRGFGAPTPVAFQGPCELHTGIDRSKDQVYFLWTLTQDDLSHTIFPVGNLNKTEVRKLAIKYKIPIATKKDSQGVCFLGQIDMKDFLKHYIETKKGDVINNDGEVIGSHDGAVFFTLGERHGFTLFKHSENDKPLYIVAKDIEKNTITVSNQRKSDLCKNVSQTYVLTSVNWILDIPENNIQYQAQIRYHGELLNCRIFGSLTSKTSKNVEIMLEKDILVDKGQSIVFYDGEVCLGGGIVE